MNPFRRKATPPTPEPDPFEGRSDDDLVGFSDLAKAGLHHREVVYLGLEGVLERRVVPEGVPGHEQGRQEFTVGSARRYLRQRTGPPQEERLVYRLPTPTPRPPR